MLVQKKSTWFFAKNESGGKGYNLYLLSNMGFNVPDWVIFGKSYFARFIKNNNLHDSIQEILQQFQEKQLTADQAEEKITKLIQQKNMTPDLIHDLEQILQDPDFKKNLFFSVRSSAVDEDGLKNSFAGQLSSFLYIYQKNSILESIKNCWISAYSARSLSYRLENNLPLNEIAVAVILQKMIDAEKSGVVFTQDPSSSNMDNMLVSTVYGVGEGLVSGELDADSFWLNKQDGKPVKDHIVEKKEMFKQEESGGCKKYLVNESLQTSPVLNPYELQSLWLMCKNIEDKYYRPQDIEWCFYENKFYILQTRPITTLKTNNFGYPHLWDNSNIVESYGGLTLPLSFSFALRNYKNVYVQFCEILGVPNEVVKDMDYYLSYMLGSLNGRVYYNLYNWYKLVGVLPGFRHNREFMETMMGVSQKLTDEIADRIQPHPSWNTFLGRIRKLKIGFNFLRFHFTIQSVVDQFLKTFKKDYNYYRSLPLRQMRADQLLQIYFKIERNMLGRWKAPIINDFLCMVHFGILKKLTRLWLKDLDENIQNDLISNEGGLESSMPTQELLILAKEAQKNLQLKNLLLQVDSQDGLEALCQSQFVDFYQKVSKYIDDYGFRCMSEMKLEEIDLVSNPSYIFSCLKNYLKSDIIIADDPLHASKLRSHAEEKVKSYLSSFWKKNIYFWVLKQARKAVKNRENTRFARTRAYGLARTIFQTIGEDLSQQKILQEPKDIFWLTIDEVFGVFQGTLSCYNLQGFVTLRKDQYKNFQEDIDSRIATRGPVYWHNNFTVQDSFSPSHHPEGVDLAGLPCCPGIVEGVVKIIESPQDSLDLNQEILVAARTDPGWVPLYPSISGLLVERGSLLSHSAIVAREMGLPTIVAIPGLLKKLKNGMRIRMDGTTGMIVILNGDKNV